MPTEADPCRTLVTPKLQVAGCGNDRHSIAEQRSFTDGELRFTLPDVLKLPPISQHGSANEIIDKFGHADKLRQAVNRLQLLRYSA